MPPKSSLSFSANVQLTQQRFQERRRPSPPRPPRVRSWFRWPLRVAAVLSISVVGVSVAMPAVPAVSSSPPSASATPRPSVAPMSPVAIEPVPVAPPPPPMAPLTWSRFVDEIERDYRRIAALASPEELRVIDGWMIQVRRAARDGDERALADAVRQCNCCIDFCNDTLRGGGERSAALGSTGRSGASASSALPKLLNSSVGQDGGPAGTGNAPWPAQPNETAPPTGPVHEEPAQESGAPPAVPEHRPAQALLVPLGAGGGELSICGCESPLLLLVWLRGDPASLVLAAGVRRGADTRFHVPGDVQGSWSEVEVLLVRLPAAGEPIGFAALSTPPLLAPQTLVWSPWSTAWSCLAHDHVRVAAGQNSI